MDSLLPGIAGGLIAIIVATMVGWIARRVVPPAWSWASGTVKGIWVNAVNNAVEPLRRDIKSDIGRVKRTVTRIDGVVSSLQLRVDDQLDPHNARASGSPKHKEKAESQSSQNKQADQPEDAEHGDG